MAYRLRLPDEKVSAGFKALVEFANKPAFCFIVKVYHHVPAKNRVKLAPKRVIFFH